MTNSFFFLTLWDSACDRNEKKIVQKHVSRTCFYLLRKLFITFTLLTKCKKMLSHPITGINCCFETFFPLYY